MPPMIGRPRLFPHGWTSGRIGRNARLDCVPLGAIFRISPVSAMLIYVLPRRSIWMPSGVSNAAGLNRATVSTPCAEPLWAKTAAAPAHIVKSDVRAMTRPFRYRPAVGFWLRLTPSASISVWTSRHWTRFFGIELRLSMFFLLIFGLAFLFSVVVVNLGRAISGFETGCHRRTPVKAETRREISHPKKKSV